MIKVTLKDGKVLEVEKGKTILEVAKQISEGLARMATCGEVNGKVEDLRYELNEDCSLNICTFENSEEGKKAYWHTTAHIMAQAIKRLFPNVQLAIGPAIANGFYYDFDTEHRFSEEDFEKIKQIRQEYLKGTPVQETDILNNIPTEISIDENCYYLDESILKDIGVKETDSEKTE